MGCQQIFEVLVFTSVQSHETVVFGSWRQFSRRQMSTRRSSDNFPLNTPKQMPQSLIQILNMLISNLPQNLLPKMLANREVPATVDNNIADEPRLSPLHLIKSYSLLIKIDIAQLGRILKHNSFITIVEGSPEAK
jgi:hypothetical protein